MTVPFPSDTEVDLDPPSFEESRLNAAAILSATRPAEGNSEFQRLLIAATFESMTGHRIDTHDLPTVDAETNARNLARRAEGFRMRKGEVLVSAVYELSTGRVRIFFASWFRSQS